MKKGKIPTIVGIIVLVFGLAAGVIAVQSKLFLRLGATGESSPKNVRITNIGPSSFSVSWLTDIQINGFIVYGESESNLAGVKTETSTGPNYAHLTEITGLKPGTTYFFKINSGDEVFDNNGVAWQIQTKEESPQEDSTFLISGNVLTATSTPVANALVYVSAGAATFSTLISQNGNWIIPLPSSLNNSSTLLEISVQAGADGISTAQIYPTSANPVPTMILGQTHDFRNLPPSEGTEIPAASVVIPEETTPESGFDVTNSTVNSTVKTVTLESLVDGEIINTTKPELLGDAPAGTVLTIVIESEVINGEVTVPASEKWSWEVPTDLTPGEHKVTITWKDATGITRTLIRSFVVSAAEGPAFEATPSATPTFTPISTPTTTPEASPSTPTTTPEATFTPTPTLFATASATPFPVPESGSLTPTIFVSIMGVGLIIFGFIFWKESNA